MEVKSHGLYSAGVIAKDPLAPDKDKHLANVAVKMEVESHDATKPSKRPLRARILSSKYTNLQCRVCLEQGSKSTLKPLFSCKDLFDRFQSLMLPHFRHTFGALSIDLDANAPDKICGVCLRMFNYADLFVNMVLDAEVVLRRKFKKQIKRQTLVPSPVIGGRNESAGPRNGFVRMGFNKSSSLFQCPAIDLCDSGDDQQIDAGVIPDDKLGTPAQAVRCYTRKSGARKGLVKRETSPGCLDESSSSLQGLLTKDEKSAISDEVKPPIVQHFVILPRLGEGSIALPNLLTKDQIKSESEPSLPLDHNQTQGIDLSTINVDSTSNALRNGDDTIVKYIPNSVWEKGVGQLCENCGEILTVSRFQHYKKSAQCNREAPKCKECGRIFRDQNNLIRHMVVHTDELPFHCNLCPMKYKHDTNLKRHVALHAEGNAHVCEACGKSFSTRHYMLVHRRVHVDPSLAINCNYCPEKLENQQQLDHHIEDKHMDEYIEDQFAKGQPLPAVLQCHFCVRKFLDPKRRKKHEFVHSYSKRRARARNANKTYVELNEQKKKGKGTTKRRISRRRKQDNEVS